jgi:hypothetical protein
MGVTPEKLGTQPDATVVSFKDVLGFLDRRNGS